MRIRRFLAAGAAAALIWLSTAGAGLPAAARPSAEDGLKNWYGLVLELVRHTATYSPPVAARALGYLGVTAFEATAGGSLQLVTLAGQLNGLEEVPRRAAGEPYDEAVVINAAMAAAVESFFSNTGPTGQRAIAAARRKWSATAAAGVAPDIVARSLAYGEAVAAHIHAWSLDDGGAVIENMGFPLDYALSAGPDKWVPTNRIGLQQLPLLPGWGDNRPFAMPAGTSCPVPPPPAYSEDPASQFYAEAVEVYETVRAITPEKAAIARFWSDDPMLSTTPPGHWVSIALQIMTQKHLALEPSVDLLARLGISLADAFIGCWHEKYVYDLVRPVTYIRRLIDPTWEPILATPPFPEYPSGHSTASGAAATVLTAFLGEHFVFEDGTGSPDGLGPRRHESFWAAADEAGISRLYGGIHYRAAIELGLDQGRCIGAYAVALETRR